MKSWKTIARLRKPPYSFRDFKKAAWPAMCEQERDGGLNLAPLVQEMNVQSLKLFDRNINREVR
jgi:hypothetical protein